MSVYEAKHYSFELNPEMMAALAEEFDVDTLTSDFVKAVQGKTGDELEAEAESFFTDYGTRWIRRSQKSPGPRSEQSTQPPHSAHK